MVNYLLYMHCTPYKSVHINYQSTVLSCKSHRCPSSVVSNAQIRRTYIDNLFRGVCVCRIIYSMEISNVITYVLKQLLSQYDYESVVIAIIR